MPPCWLPAIFCWSCRMRMAGRWEAPRWPQLSSSFWECGCAPVPSRTSELQSFETMQLCGAPAAAKCYARSQLVDRTHCVGVHSGGVAADRQHGCGRRIQAQAHGALSARLAAACLLGMVLRADAGGGVCSVQTGLVDTRPQRSAQTGVEHGRPILVGLRDLDYGMGRAVVDGRYAGGKRGP